MLQNNETSFKLWKKYPLVRNLYNIQVRMLNQHNVKEREKIAANLKSAPQFRIPKEKGYECWFDNDRLKITFLFDLKFHETAWALLQRQAMI